MTDEATASKATIANDKNTLFGDTDMVPRTSPIPTIGIVLTIGCTSFLKSVR
jgi:hypothetical protein